MQWFLNRRTATKLFIGFALVILFLIAVIVTACTSFRAIQQNSNVALDVQNVEINFHRQRADLLTMMAVGNRAEQEAALQDLKTCAKENEVLLQRLRTFAQKDKQRTAQFDKLAATWDLFAKTRDEQLIPMILEGKAEQAKPIALVVQNERYQTVRQLAKALGDDAQKQSDQRVTQSLIVFLAAGLMALALAAVLIGLMKQSIARPLEEISSVAERIASGDLAVNVSSNNRRD